jgi:hypothetical protein
MEARKINGGVASCYVYVHSKEDILNFCKSCLKLERKSFP